VVYVDDGGEKKPNSPPGIRPQITFETQTDLEAPNWA